MSGRLDLPDPERDEDRYYAVLPPAEVFTTNDLPSVSVEQVGKPKELRWRKKKVRRKRRR